MFAPNGSYGPPRLPAMFRRWFDVVRVLVFFTLGVAMIIYATVSSGHDVPFIVAGLVLCGMVPVDLWLSSHRDACTTDDTEAR
jgi:hypothetical protein